MITTVKDIVSDNPLRQVWKHLRSYLHTDYAAAEIRRIQIIGSDVSEKNIRKQAGQIGQCIRQAEEYFNASESVGLATRPLLLYYGAIALCQALVLLRKDGTNSLDYIRNSSDAENQSRHGLELNRGLVQEIHPKMAIQDILTKIQCKVDRRDGIPRGFFARMYRAILPDSAQCIQRSRYNGQAMSLEKYHIFPHFDMPEIDYILKKPVSVLDCIDTMPDMYWSMIDLNLKVFLFRCNVNQFIDLHHLENSETNITAVKLSTFDVYVSDIDDDSKGQLFEVLGNDSRYTKIEDIPNHLHFRLTLNYNNEDGVRPIRLPIIISNLYGQQFLVKPGYGYSSDIIGMFIPLYCLGMLARYFPDKWMPVIDGNIVASELIDTLLNVIYRKLPNLILDQMSEVKHYIHI